MLGAVGPRPERAPDLVVFPRPRQLARTHETTLAPGRSDPRNPRGRSARVYGCHRADEMGIKRPHISRAVDAFAQYEFAHRLRMQRALSDPRSPKRDQIDVVAARAPIGSEDCPFPVPRNVGDPLGIEIMGPGVHLAEA